MSRFVAVRLDWSGVQTTFNPVTFFRSFYIRSVNAIFLSLTNFVSKAWNLILSSKIRKNCFKFFDDVLLENIRNPFAC